MHRVTAAVVTYQGEGLISDLAETLHGLPGVKCVIYDSGSTDSTTDLILETIPRAKLISGENRGFGHGNNRCIENIRSEYTLLLNSDARINEESLALLVKFLDENPAFAGVQPVVKIWGWPLVTASRGVFLTKYGEAWDSGFMHLEPFVPSEPLEVPAITAAVSLWRTSVLRSVGGFDEDFFMYFEDADLSLRVQAEGWKLAVAAASVAEHMVGASSSRREAVLWELASSVIMFRRYMGSSPGTLLHREIRFLAGNLLRGRNPIPRIKTFLSAAGKSVKTVELPERLRSTLFGTASDMPLKRPERGSPGPGWQGSLASPWAGVRLNSDKVSITLESTGHAVTGVLLEGGGEILRRFTIPKGGSRNYRLAVPARVVYIKCDMNDDNVKVDIQ